MKLYRSMRSSPNVTGRIPANSELIRKRLMPPLNSICLKYDLYPIEGASDIFALVPKGTRVPIETKFYA